MARPADFPDVDAQIKFPKVRACIRIHMPGLDASLLSASCFAEPLTMTPSHEL